MIIKIIKQDVKTMSNAELIKERKQLCRAISSVEKEQIVMENSCVPIWIEDQSIKYAWDIERLEEILLEIKRRMTTADWIFVEEHNFFPSINNGGKEQWNYCT